MSPSTDPALPAPDSLGALVQDYVRTQCRVILAAGDALRARDEDAVHPARVAIRRLRATLRTFEVVYRRVDREQFAQELQWLGGLLSGVRDLQVLAARFDADPHVPGSVAGVLRDEFAARRAAAWDTAVAQIDGARGIAAVAVVARWLEDPPLRRGAGRPAHAARGLVADAEAELERRLRRARETRDDEDVHTARKAVKRHRYAVELARPVLDAGASATIAHRQALQDALGAHQDAVVAVAFLRSIGTNRMDAATTDDLHELIRRAQHRAGDLDEMWTALR